MRENLATSEKKDVVSASLEQFIAQKKANKASENLIKYMDNLLNFWYYQYLDIFHVKPDTIEDMLMGLKYMLMKRQQREMKRSSRKKNG